MDDIPPWIQDLKAKLAPRSHGLTVSRSPGWPRNHAVKDDLDLLILLPPPHKRLDDQFTTCPAMSSLYHDED